MDVQASVIQEIIYYKVAKEYLFYEAQGDEKGKLFHFEYYPIRDFSVSDAKIYVQASGDAAVELDADTDYLIDTDEGSIILLKEIEEGSACYVTAYEYESVYYEYIYNIRTILGDVDHKAFLYKNKDLIKIMHQVLFQQIYNQTEWDITYDETYQRIMTVIRDFKLMFLAGLSALQVLEGQYRRKLNTGIYIKDGPTTIDTTKAVGSFDTQVNKYRKDLILEFNDELIFGRESTDMIGMVDGIKILAGYAVDEDE